VYGQLDRRGEVLRIKTIRNSNSQLTARKGYGGANGGRGEQMETRTARRMAVLRVRVEQFPQRESIGFCAAHEEDSLASDLHHSKQ
jgi:hypothetical protein